MKTKLIRIISTFALLATLACHSQAGLFGPKGDDSQEKRATVRQQRDEMLAQLFASNPALKETVQKSAGYATFNQKDMNLFLLASGNGFGVLVDNNARKEVFMRMASLGSGVGFGVKDIRVIFIFHDEKVMKQFVEQGWQFGGKADVSAKYDETGVAAEQNLKSNVDFREGTVSAGSSTDIRAGTDQAGSTVATVTTRGAMEIYQFTEKGLSLQATVSGTKYWTDSRLNP